MKCLNLVLIILLVTLAVSVEGRFFLKIDNFFQTGAPCILVIAMDAPDDAWYTPYETFTLYYYVEGSPPAFVFHTTEGAVGGQRDLIVGYEGVSPAGSIASMSISQRRASVGFPENFVGGAYMQWDGDDFANGGRGFLLNTSPGMGAAINTTQYPERNGDSSVDFTSGGKAFGIYIDTTTDHDGTAYYMDAFDLTGNFATFAWSANAVTNPDGSPKQVQYFNRFSAFTFQGPSAFKWTHVVAFQVRLFTFRPGQGQGSNNAVDSSFAFLNTFGYVVAGSVVLDCDCVSTANSVSPVNGQRMDLRQGSTSSGTVLATTTTDSNGKFEFVGDFLTEGSQYTVCFNDFSVSRCSPSSGCLTVTLNGLADPAELLFTKTSVSTLTAPPARTVQCGDCTDVACTGTASIADCAGNTTPVNTHTDVTAGTCPRVITRTFTASGLTATQRITIEDSQPPVITTQAQNSLQTCTGSNPTLNTWINTQAGAIATDCNTFTWTNNWNQQQVNSCSGITVTFTATDLCNNSGPLSRTTATYSISDSVPPVITRQATAGTSQCNQNGSDFTALNAWLNTQGGALATDNCVTFTWTNNYNPLSDPFVRSCSSSKTIVFTAQDGCLNVATTSALYTFIDDSPPVLTTPAQSSSGECSASGAAFNAWLGNHANAVATDVCQPSANLLWSNNFVGSVPNGCNAVATVTFTVTDGCGGNTLATTASFTVTDTTAPTITTPAAPLNVICSDPGAANALNNWLANAGGAVATDACTAVTWSNNFNPLTANCAATTVTFTASDNCLQNSGTHTARTTAIYSVQDTVAPTFAVPPASLNVECSSANINTQFTQWLTTNGGAVVTDNCASGANIVITNNWPVGTFPPSNACLSVNTVSFVARDPCGNSSPGVTATFTVSDNFSPVINPFAEDESIECQPNQNTLFSSWVNSRGGAVATDACTAVSWTNNAPTRPNFDGCFGETEVIFTARDTCSHTSTSIASFTITDTTPPQITTEASDRTDECTGVNQSTTLNAWLNSNGGAIAIDSCTAVEWTNNFSSLSEGCNQFADVTFTATDECGMSDTTFATYSLTDSVGPVITVPARNLAVPCNSNTQQAARDWVNNNGYAVAVDTCDPDNVFWVPQLVNDVVGCNFVTVTFTVFDGCGHSSSTTATFTSVDSDAPTFDPPAQNLLVECNGGGNTESYLEWLSRNGGAVAVDECALRFTWSNNAPALGPSGCGTQTVTFTVTDECFNTASTTATYTVIDTDPPVFFILPDDLVVECDGFGNLDDLDAWLDDLAGADVFDVCTIDSQIRLTYLETHQIGDTCSYFKQFTFYAEDTCGNRAAATANFGVIDLVAPFYIEDPEDLTVECDGNGNINQITGWIDSHANSVADDLCQPVVLYANDYPGSGPLPCTSQLITFFISDSCGNIVSESGLVTVTDVTDPLWDFFPEDYEVLCDHDISTENLGVPIARDVCYGQVPVTLEEFEFDDPPIGNCPGDHVITRRWSASDECANVIVRDQEIRVNLVRSSGPCEPEGCDCDECCPSPEPMDCLSVPCEVADCLESNCKATPCTCQLGGTTSKSVINSFIALPKDLVEPLPQCKPVYIYINDDDDEEQLQPAVIGSIPKQRMFVTTELIHEDRVRSTSGSSILSISFVLLIVVAFLF